jgi:hypothetical protein
MPPEEAGFELTEMAFSTENTDAYQRGPQPGDDSLLVKFFSLSVRDEGKSRAAGRPIYIDRDHVEIRVLGDRTNFIAREATPADIDRFPRHYQAYKTRTTTKPIEGTPLAEWAVITRAQVDELAYFNVRTVEQLSRIPDNRLGAIFGLAGLKERAKAWLAATGDTRAAEELARKLQERDLKIAELSQQIAGLQAAVAKLQPSVGLERPSRVPEDEEEEDDENDDDDGEKPLEDSGLFIPPDALGLPESDEPVVGATEVAAPVDNAPILQRRRRASRET